MRPAADDVATFLTSGQSKWSGGTNVFVGFQQSQPNEAIIVWDRPGMPPSRYQAASHAATERPGVQVMCRATTYLSGYAIARYVTGRLQAVVNQNVAQGTGVAAVRYGIITQQGDIVPLGKDDQQRYQFSVNFLVVREQVA